MCLISCKFEINLISISYDSLRSVFILSFCNLSYWSQEKSHFSHVIYTSSHFWISRTWLDENTHWIFITLSENLMKPENTFCRSYKYRFLIKYFKSPDEDVLISACFISKNNIIFPYPCWHMSHALLVCCQQWILNTKYNTKDCLAVCFVDRGGYKQS